MLKKLASSTVAVLALAAVAAAPALAGGGQCSSAAAAHCSARSGARATAWAGACLERSATGTVSVAAVAPGSPAAKAGLRAGDIVTAVNGYQLADSQQRATCSASAECSVGRQVTYTVQRGAKSKDFKVTLVKMPHDAASRFASAEAAFEPALAALVMPASSK